MHVKTMEGLSGAHTNYNLLKVPFRVYKDARRRGDLGVMERAMGYVSDFAGKSQEYQAEAEEGRAEEREEAREREKLELEKAIEKRKAEGGKTEGTQEGEPSPKTDTLELSPEGKAISQNCPSQNKPEKENAILPGATKDAKKEPLLYSPAGKVALAEPQALKISITA